MKFTYRTYRFQIVPLLTFVLSSGVYEVDTSTQSWAYRISNSTGFIILDSNTATPPDNQSDVLTAINEAIASINNMIEVGETSPVADTPGSAI